MRITENRLWDVTEEYQRALHPKQDHEQQLDMQKAIVVALYGILEELGEINKKLALSSPLLDGPAHYLDTEGSNRDLC